MRIRKAIFGVTISLVICTALISNIAFTQDTLRIDLFSQPDDSTLNYYGSGDVYMDNQITCDDVKRFDSLLVGNLSYQLDDKLRDRADVDGDGFVTVKDRDILENYLTNDKYLPADWNNLTRYKKLKWFEKMILIDSTDILPDGMPSYGYAIPFAINFHGFCSKTGVDILTKRYTFTSNGRFNIPVFTVVTICEEGVHTINGVLIGDDPFNIKGWYFFDPKMDNRVYPVDWSINCGCKIGIDYVRGKTKDNEIWISRILKFNIDKYGKSTIYKDYDTALFNIVKYNPHKGFMPAGKVGQFIMLFAFWQL